MPHGSKHLSPEERGRVRVLYHDAGFTEAQICRITNYTSDQVHKAVFYQYGPRKRKGPSPALGPNEETELIEFIQQSRENRQLPWARISTTLFDGQYGYKAIRNTFKRLGYKRYQARSKPPLTPERMIARKAFAQEHMNWTVEQWSRILWSDETWVTWGLHRKPYVTRTPDEEFDNDCVVDKIKKKGGWMFWGCFSGAHGKGPGIFWEKDWGYITSQTYRDRIIPVVDGWIRLCESEGGVRHAFMQDNAPGHNALDTLVDLEERGVEVIQWPAFSPDLNPIETVWCWMKDYIQKNRRLASRTDRRPKPPLPTGLGGKWWPYQSLDTYSTE